MLAPPRGAAPPLLHPGSASWRKEFLLCSDPFHIVTLTKVLGRALSRKTRSWIPAFAGMTMEDAVIAGLTDQREGGILLWQLNTLLSRGGSSLNDVGHQLVKIVSISRPAGRAVVIRCYYRRKLQLRHNIKHLPAVTPGVTDILAGNLTQGPAVAVTIAGEAGTGARLP